jgi:hypothetical protein
LRNPEEVRSIFMRTECGAIGKILNAIAGFLATELTDLQRQNLHKRMAEEYVHLERLEKSQTQP